MYTLVIFLIQKLIWNKIECQFLQIEKSYPNQLFARDSNKYNFKNKNSFFLFILSILSLLHQRLNSSLFSFLIFFLLIYQWVFFFSRYEKNSLFWIFSTTKTNLSTQQLMMHFFWKELVSGQIHPAFLFKWKINKFSSKVDWKSFFFLKKSKLWRRS